MYTGMTTKNPITMIWQAWHRVNPYRWEKWVVCPMGDFTEAASLGMVHELGETGDTKQH